MADELDKGVQAPLAMTCPACAKTLRVRAELAGKKVRCPECGQSVWVPGTQASASGRRLLLIAALVLLALAIAAPIVIRSRGRTEDMVASWLDQPLGTQPLAEIVEEGFYGREVSEASGIAFRWTNGAAKLVIPLHGPPPTGLHIRLILPGLPAYRLSIQVNGKALFEDQLALNGLWSETFDLSTMTLGKELTVEIQSGSHIPANIRKGSKDERILGVRLVAITLLSGAKTFVDVPLGALETPDVKESGFLQPDFPGKQPARWTDGAARLIVPLRGKTPKALALTLEVPNKPRYQVSVTVNGKKLVDEQLEGDPTIKSILGRDWSAEVPLGNVELGDNASIELDSSTLVPGELTPAHGENRGRPLGVRVKQLMLISDSDAARKR